jgi:hypothetical protein
MKPIISFVACAIASSVGIMPVLSGQGGSTAPSPQSLVGDWEWSINGPVKAVLHIKLDANGVLAGTAVIPGAKTFDLKDMHLSGRALTYTMAPYPAITEQISVDGNSMVGPQPWRRAGTALVPARQLVGNWVYGGTNPSTLRLRSDGNGGLTGSLEVFGAKPNRQPLTSVHFDGTTLSYKTADGSEYTGQLSDNGKDVIGRTAGSPMWTQVEHEEQALLDDVNEKQQVAVRLQAAAAAASAAKPAVLPSCKPDNTGDPRIAAACRNQGLPQVSPLDASKLLTYSPKPIYPCLREHAKGQARLQFTVRADGTVSDISDLDNIPAPAQGTSSCRKDFVNVSMGAVGLWKYKPYLVNGQPTAMRTTVQIVFDFDGELVHIVYQ